jgi:AraC-like DNA-binding protein/mannose-6-phosphate isomerase-like protein (cupin superfamily)
MKPARSQPKLADRKAFATLLSACRGLSFKPHDIARQLDNRGHYDLPLDKEFPFHVTLFHFESGKYTSTWNWHERLELTMPLDGVTRMRMGDQIVELAPGDLLVVDNLKLHNVEDFPGFDTRVVVMSFMPEFVYTPGSPSCDYTFLLPFYTKREGHPHVLRASDPLAGPVYLAMAELLQRYFRSKEPPHAQCGCKASFLQVLFQLLKRFQSSEVLRSEFVQRRQQAERLARLFEFVRLNYAERISVDQAMKLVHMSQAQFMKVFKKVAGMTFVAHVTRVRITNALRLLRETDLTIAEIAAKTGFPDQSYFDRRFKQAFRKSPRQFRQSLNTTSRKPLTHQEL